VEESDNERINMGLKPKQVKQSL